MIEPTALAIEQNGTPAPVSLWVAFRFGSSFGFISFGGPAGQIAIMHQELVERRRWISERRFYTPLITACCYPAPKPSSWPPT